MGSVNWMLVEVDSMWIIGHVITGIGVIGAYTPNSLVVTVSCVTVGQGLTILSRLIDRFSTGAYRKQK
jgi:hypothetical protein